MKKHIPNFITSCNLFSGCIGIVLATNGDLITATYFIWLAMVFDFLDGFTARLLKVHSAIGKELDSLADLVTFGVLPAVIMFQLLMPLATHPYLPFTAFAIAIFSALRLAKFNIDERQQSTFIGLPTPANALFISSLPFVIEQFPILNSLAILLAINILFSLLLIAPVELFALKFKNYSVRDNKIRYIFLLASLVLIVTLKLLALPAIIILYLALSILKNVAFN